MADGRVDHMMRKKVSDAIVGIAECLSAEKTGAIYLEFVDVGRFGERFCNISKDHVDISIIFCFGKNVDLLVHYVEITIPICVLLLHPLATGLMFLLLSYHYYYNCITLVLMKRLHFKKEIIYK